MDGQEFRTFLRENDRRGIISLMLLDSDSRQSAANLAREYLAQAVQAKESDLKIANRTILVGALDFIAASRNMTQHAAIDALPIGPHQPTPSDANRSSFYKFVRAHDDIGLVALSLFDNKAPGQALITAKGELAAAQERKEDPQKLAGRTLLVGALQYMAASPGLTLDRAIDHLYTAPKAPATSSPSATARVPEIA